MSGPSYHGRTHLPGGTDPIPGLTLGSGNPVFGAYDELILGTSGLVGYWPLDEASGDALDHSGNGYHFDDADFVPTVTQGEPGPFPSVPEATSYEFTGYIERETPTMATGAGSIEFWLNVPAYPAGATHIYVINIAGAGNQLSVQVRGGLAANTGEMSLDMTNSGQVFSGVDLNLDEWVHYVGVGSDTEAMKIYWNGELIATGSTVSAFALGGSAPFRIGQLSGVNIAQVALYDVVLTPGQIASHYQAGISDSYAAVGSVLTADGAGGTSWEAPTIEVDF